MLKTLDVSQIKSGEIEPSYAYGYEATWEQKGVVIPYTNAFGVSVCDVFKVALKENRGHGTILLCSGGTEFAFIVPDAWTDKSLVSFADYDGRYDNTPKAGLGGTLGEVMRRGTGVGVVDARVLLTTHRDILGDDYDEI